MGTKGHPGVYLSAVALVATSLHGCAKDIQETEPNFAVHAHVVIEPDVSGKYPAIEISSIRKVPGGDKPYTPSPNALELWLHAGDYEAKIAGCRKDDGTRDLAKEHDAMLGPDHLFRFSVKTNALYHLYCSSSSDGTIYVQLYEPLEVIGD